MTTTEKQYVDKLKELLVKSNEISTLYGKTIDSNAPFLYFHGIRASNTEIEMGNKLRDEFNQLKSEAIILEQQIEKENNPKQDFAKFKKGDRHI